MRIRTPDIRPEQGRLDWSKVPEFAIAYNGYSIVIPYVEYYLNAVINKVRQALAERQPEFAITLTLFVKQETQHSRYHVQFNERIFSLGIPGVPELVDRIVGELKTQLQTKSLAFNAAYCAGFESIATFDARYIYEECDTYLDGADANGANLLLWHVAEEFEHRSVCHDAFQAVSGNYFTRIHGLFYAFWHIGAAFVEAEKLMLQHHHTGLTSAQRRASTRRSNLLFWRQIRYVAPRMLKILLPGYNPAQLPTPPRIAAALNLFRRSDPFTARIPLGDQ